MHFNLNLSIIKSKFATIVFLFIHLTLTSQSLKLSKPLVNMQKSLLSKDGVMVSFDMRMENVSIRYTDDGKEPTEKSLLYKSAIKISKPCTLKAKAFHPSFISSESSVCVILPRGKEFSSVTVNQPHDHYKLNGSRTLTDQMLSGLNFREGYLGYEGDPVMLEVEFEKKEKIKSVIVSLLIDQSSWIFGPSSVIILDEKAKVIASKNISSSLSPQDIQFLMVEVPCSGKHRYLKIIVDPISSIPNWHQGKGEKAWLFLDEIVVR
ncbi:MAG: hypothetical protein RLZZ546_473 [Bacteroidota bacterium]